MNNTKSFPEDVNNIIDSITNNYKSALIDKVFENTILAGKESENISIRDVLDAEQSLRNDQDIFLEKEKNKRLTITMTVSISVLTMITSLFVLTFNRTNSISQLVIIIMFVIALTSLISVSFLSMTTKKDTKKTNNQKDSIQWSIVKKWSEIESIVEKNIQRQNQNVSPIEIMKWLQNQNDMPPNIKNQLINILKIRNDTVHNKNEQVYSMEQLKDIENIEYQLLDFINKKNTVLVYRKKTSNN
jgi:hypothetical protein